MAASTYSPAQGAERRQRQQQMRRLSIQSDWERSDGRSFIQCRAACSFFTFSITFIFFSFSCLLLLQLVHSW
jgi:hypothetical protein